MSENQPLNGESSAVQAHLTILQGVICRMAENSRSCKVWCVTLVAATPGLGDTDRGTTARADSIGPNTALSGPRCLLSGPGEGFPQLIRRVRGQTAQRWISSVRCLQGGADRHGVALGWEASGFGFDMAVLPSGCSYDNSRLAARNPIGHFSRKVRVVTINQVSRHKVFISYYHEDDQEYKNRLVQALDSKFVDKSVSQGDIRNERSSTGRHTPQDPG